MSAEKEINGGGSPPYKNGNNVENHEDPRHSSQFDFNMEKLSATFENPLRDVPKEQLRSDVETFCKQHNLEEYLEEFRKGALVAQSPTEAQSFLELSPDDKVALEREHTHLICSLAAAVQGMDEAVNNGAQSFYLKRFNIVEKSKGGHLTTSEVDNLTGLVVGALYLACAILGCWLIEPLNSVFARRGTIFISYFIAAVPSIWEGVANRDTNSALLASMGTGILNWVFALPAVFTIDLWG